MCYKRLETSNKPRKQKRWLSYIVRNTTHSSLDLVLQREINAKGLDSYGLLRWQTKYCVPIYELFSPLKKSTTFFSKISDTDSVKTICLDISDRWREIFPTHCETQVRFNHLKKVGFCFTFFKKQRIMKFLTFHYHKMIKQVALG